VHVFALIHDDIMDDATTRHGVDCAHAVFEKTYGKKTGESIAILLGDLVFAWSYECLARYGAQHPETRVAVEKEFATLISEVTHGQILDVLSPLDALWSLDQIIEKMTLKTARYSFVQPLRIGRAAAGSTDTTFPESFGIPLGIAFQIQDDLLDAQQSTETGKSSFTDIQTRQQTVLSWYMQTHATAEQKAHFLAYYGKPHLTTDATETLAQLLETSGARAHTAALAQEYFAKARVVATSEHALWSAVVDMVEKRKK
jgi:geranylgeranyl diphosphate synthase type I